MTAWTMNAVSAAEPSVWPQLMSPGTLRKRKYLIPPTDECPRALLEPVERVQQQLEELVVCGLASSSPSAGRLDRVEPGLDPVNVLTGAGERILVDLRVRSGPVDLGDREGLAEEQAAVVDPELVAVERADRRPRGAVALGVVLAAVARAAEAGRRCGWAPVDDVAVASVSLDFFSGSPLTWTGQPRWTQRFERIVKLGAVAEEAVVADVRGAPRDLALLRVEQVGRRSRTCSRGSRRSAPTSISGWPCLMNGGRTVKPSTGAVTTTPISPPSPRVVASRNFERGKRTTSPSPGSGIAGRPLVAPGPAERSEPARAPPAAVPEPCAARSSRRGSRGSRRSP